MEGKTWWVPLSVLTGGISTEKERSEHEDKKETGQRGGFLVAQMPGAQNERGGSLRTGVNGR